MPWWSNLKAFSRPNVILFQVDLAGHSAWIEQLTTDDATARARSDFAVRLKNALDATGFDRLNWLGDGGLFVRQEIDHEDAESVCAAADEAFRIFWDWCQPGWNLQMRVSATFAESVFVHPAEPGFWCSPILNAFLKFERDIGLPNTFVITNDLRRRFRDYSACYQRFATPRRINLGGAEQITVWLDNRFPLEVHPDPMRFMTWLRSRVADDPFTKWRSPARIDPMHALWFGDACVLNGALENSGYQAVELTLTDLPGIETALREEDQPEWNSFRNSYRKSRVTGPKLGLVKIRGELEDDPILRIQYRLNSYEDVKAFEKLIQRDTIIWNHYLPRLLRALQDGTSVPTTLSNHVVVIVGRVPKQEVMIAHRRKGRRVGGFSDNCWSVSFEEQFNPAKRRVGHRDIAADRSIPDCALRGLREEFVGDRYASSTHVSVHALLIEGSILNFAILSALELPDTTVEEIREWWSTPGIALDAEEHDFIAGIPLQISALTECLASEMLPERFREGALEVSGLVEADHRWHPTAALRLTFAMWYAEQQAARREGTRNGT